MFFFIDRSSFSVRREWCHLEVSNLQPQSLQRPHQKNVFPAQDRSTVYQPQVLAHVSTCRRGEVEFFGWVEIYARGGESVR